MLGFVCVSLNLVQTDRQKGCHIIIVNHICQSYWADMVNHAPPRVDEVSTDVWSTWVYVGGLKRMSGWFDLTVEKNEEKKRNISETLQKVVLFQNFQWGLGSFQTPNFVYTVWKSYPTLTFKLMKHQCVRENERVPSLVRWGTLRGRHRRARHWKYSKQEWTDEDDADRTALLAWIIQARFWRWVLTSKSDWGPLSRAPAATSSRTLWSCRAAETIRHHWVILTHQREKSNASCCTTGSLLLQTLYFCRFSWETKTGNLKQNKLKDKHRQTVETDMFAINNLHSKDNKS